MTERTWRYTLPAAGTVDREVAAARLWTAGALGMWEREEAIVAWFDAPTEDAPPGGDWSREPDRDWREEWKAGLEAIEAGPFTIVPSWLADEHDPAPDRTVIVLDPAAAFGSGHHATTRMCLEEIGALDLTDRSVLDVGTGSGILAIAAAHVGASEVTAVDTDPRAVATARDNVARAGVTVHVATGSVEAAHGGPFDVVLANILSDTLLDLHVALVQKVAPGGHLVMSGLTPARTGEIIAAVAATGLDDPAAVREQHGWTLLRWDRSGHADTLGSDPHVHRDHR